MRGRNRTLLFSSYTMCYIVNRCGHMCHGTMMTQNRFTFHKNIDDFENAISSNFSAVRNYDALRSRLVRFGFESNGAEYWHTDGLFCKGKPELLLQIREKKPVQAQPPRPHSYSQEDKINAMSHSKREAGNLDLWTSKLNCP